MHHNQLPPTGELEMNYSFDEVRVRIDHVTVTSDDKRRIVFNPRCVKGYKYLGRKPTVDPEESYSIFHEYRHIKTRNKVHVFTERNDDALYLPNLSIKFFPTWEYPLKYSEGVDVVNCITQEHNMAFNLSQYHVAVDLFSKQHHLDRLVSWTKSGRQYDPEKDSKYPGTYYFHSDASVFQLIAYDKKKELIDKKKLTRQGKQALKNRNVGRFESRFYHASEISTLEQLAIHCFIDLYPRHLKFLEPDDLKLSKHGIKPRSYRGLGLKGLRTLLKQHGTDSNFFSYTRDNPELSGMVKRALMKFRWCETPDKHPIALPKLVVRPQGVKFIKH